MRLPRIGETALVRVPQVVGGWAPVILLPAGFLAGLPAAQTEAVLAHELAHLVRRDFWLNALQSLAEALFFFHPAVHAINGHIRRERERACDDLAVAWTGDSLGYARALAALAGAVPTSPTAASCVLAADGHEPGELRSRIGRLLGRPVAGRINWAPGGWLVIGAVAAYAALFAASPVIVAQVMSPEERTKVVQEAVKETQPRQALSGGKRLYPEGKIKILSELRTEDGSPVPKQVWGMFRTSNGDTGAGGSFGWTHGRGNESETTGVVSLMALPEDGWAPAVVFDVKPVAGASEVVVPPMTLRKGRPLRVRLGEPDGKALAGVKVEVRVWPRGADHLNYFYRKPWVSDEAGMIVLPNADPGFAYQVTADLPGRQGTRRVIENFSPDQTVAWVLPAARAIRGQVVDKTDGTVVAGAKVWLALVSGVEGLYAQNFDELPLATTDAEGRFELPGWDDGGIYALRFVHATHANALARVRPGETLRVEMEPGGHRVSGRVKVLTERARGFMRQPRMSVVSWISTGSRSFAPSLAECTMTPEGGDVYRFEFERLPSGATDFSVHGASSRGTRIQLRGDRDGVELTMDDRWLAFAEESPEGQAAKAAERAQEAPEPTGPRRAVEINVKASDGGRVPDFRLSYVAMPADASKDSPGRPSAYTEVRDGKVVLPDLPVRAKVSLFAFDGRLQGYWIADPSFEVPEGEGVHRQEIVAHPAGVAVVDVLEADGLPRVYDRVGLEGRDPFVAEDRAGRFSSEGNFGTKQSRATINSVPLGGKYRVVAQAGARVARSEWFTLDAARPRADVQVRFAEGRPVTARVRGADGKPLAAVNVVLGYQSDFIEYVPVWADTVSTNASGYAVFPVATVDDSVRYRLRVSPRRDWQPQAKTVSSARPDEWVFTLLPGAKLSGRVVDGDGKPVENARVAAYVDAGDDRPKAASVPEMPAESATDADGRFRFSNLVSARLAFRVEQRGPGKGGEFPRLEVKGDVKEELVIVVR